MGPATMGGMQWDTCDLLQAGEKLCFFLSHVRRRDKLGGMLRMLTETVQVYAGLAEPVLERKIDWQKWVERTWLHYLKQRLDAIDGKIKTTFRIQRPARSFDRSLMEIFSNWNA